jgi:hypothetical protein
MADLEVERGRLWFGRTATFFLCQRNEHRNQEWVIERIRLVMEVREPARTVYPGEISVMPRVKKLPSSDRSLVVVETFKRDGLASRAPERDRHASVHDTSVRALVEVETSDLPWAFKKCQQRSAWSN